MNRRPIYNGEIRVIDTYRHPASPSPPANRASAAAFRGDNDAPRPEVSANDLWIIEGKHSGRIYDLHPANCPRLTALMTRIHEEPVEEEAKSGSELPVYSVFVANN